jgi:glycosyltransferase involved in cell wall biosynthesis
MLERAVKSVLAQTYRNLQVVVIADGPQDLDPLPKDDRLVVFQLRENHGTYFAQQVSLMASPYDWYAPHGSDDWCDPEHIEKLLAMESSAVASGAVWWHQDGHPVKVHRANYEVGLFATERLRDFGGYNPIERMGQDSLTLKLLGITGGFVSTTEPTYHRVRRAGSLTTHPDTKIGSMGRNEMRARNRLIWSKVMAMKDPLAIDYARSLFIPKQVREAVDQYVRELRKELG